MKLFFHKGMPFVTYAILLVNVTVFLMMLIRYQSTTSVEALINFGAKSNGHILLKSEWWRLLTPTFVHIGIEHLLFNCLSLYFIGQELEKLMGHVRFLLLFLIASFGGNLFSFAFNDNISAGASTGIFGLFVAYIVLAIMYPQLSMLKQRAINFSLLILLNFMTSLFSQGIDNWGHFGGAVFGGIATANLGIGSPLDSSLTRTQKGLLIILGIGLTLILLAIRLF